MKIAITGCGGVNSKHSRDDLESLILQHGGKVASNVSGRTSFLVAGDILEDGRPVTEGNKYRTALEKKVKIISEAELLDLIDGAVASAAAKNENEMIAASDNCHSSSSCRDSLSNLNDNNYNLQQQQQAKQPTTTISSLSVGSSKKSSSLPQSSSSSSLGCHVSQDCSSSQLWVDKHRPKTSAQLIGSSEIVRKLGDWLRQWDKLHLHRSSGSSNNAASSSVKVPYTKENPGAKAVLLSGPPGIGKSTVASLAASELGYDVMELNASDTRNRKEIEAQLSSAVSSMAISTTTTGNNSNNNAITTCKKRRLVIMDEVDGMGGSDRGGIAELIKIIKTTKIPIICICNDRQSTKIRSLVNHCYDLRVKRPTKQQIAQRLVAIAAEEGMSMDSNAAEMLVEQCGNDIRQALNAMQMWRASSTTMHYLDVKAGLDRIEKDKILRQSPFDACGLILGGSGGNNRVSFQDRYESYFIDYALCPLLIQQNYIDAAKNGIFRNPALSEADRLDHLATAAAAVSDSDLAGAAIMGQNQHWELLPTQAVFCVRAGSCVQGYQGFPSFPAWLGKNSAKSKMVRLTKEIVHHTALTIGQVSKS